MTIRRIAVLTGGGDAQGMNAAVRAVVRTALDRGVEVFAVYEGYQGLVDGGDCFHRMEWESVGGILQQGGTVIGTARCKEFFDHEGRRKAASNVVFNDIDGLVMIGGDGSLTGMEIFHREWPSLMKELVEKNEITQAQADRHPVLGVVGLPGSIDNDIYGSDVTIGTDTALHRIVEAIDAISSTASSHQRSFVVEVMGRNCGYLAMIGALATGSDWVLVPENPPGAEIWKNEMCASLKGGREAGRRDNIVVVAEGARDSEGNPITCEDVKNAIEEQLGEEARVTILGHVQRGGAPSAFDRILGTLLGHKAVEFLLDSPADAEPHLIGMRGNRIVSTPLAACVRQTQSITESIARKDYEQVMEMRGSGVLSARPALETIIQAAPSGAPPGVRKLRIAVMHSGAPAPGMNAAVRAAVRLGLDKGHTIIGIQNGFPGLINGETLELRWMSVNGWAGLGGAELGTNRDVPKDGDFYSVARTIENSSIDALLMIGGEAGFDGAYEMFRRRRDYPGFNIPIVCLPATIDNDRPGSELSVGTDTALNSIVAAVDKIKQSAVATRRCFVVELMGGYCGYLALMGGFATGSERVYLHEEGLTLKDLQFDLEYLLRGFRQGKRLGVLIRNARAHDVYTTDFIARLFEAEGGDLFDVRQAILGHLQQGGDPSPFDRVQAIRLTDLSIDFLIAEAGKKNPGAVIVGHQGGEMGFTSLADYPEVADQVYGRPKEQWWLELRDIARVLAQPGPGRGLLP